MLSCLGVQIYRQYKRGNPSIAHKDVMTLTVDVQNLTGIRRFSIRLLD